MYKLLHDNELIWKACWSFISTFMDSCCIQMTNILSVILFNVSTITQGVIQQRLFAYLEVAFTSNMVRNLCNIFYCWHHYEIHLSQNIWCFAGWKFFLCNVSVMIWDLIVQLAFYSVAMAQNAWIFLIFFLFMFHVYHTFALYFMFTFYF